MKHIYTSDPDFIPGHEARQNFITKIMKALDDCHPVLDDEMLTSFSKRHVEVLNNTELKRRLDGFCLFMLFFHSSTQLSPQT